MQESLISMFRHIHPVVLYPVVWVWIVFYIAFGHAGRRGIWHYWNLRPCSGRSGLRHWLWCAGNLYLTYLEFGKAILDRFAAYSGRHIRVRIEGAEVLDELTNRSDGFMVLSSHIGNQELAGYSFQMPKPMYVLVHVGDTETVNENRREAFERMGLHIIPVRQDGSHVLEMHNALSDGNILSVHADRLFFGTKAISKPILGESANWPEGPFRIAVAERVPVVTLFMMRERAGEYTLHVRALASGDYSSMQRLARVDWLAEQYVTTIEEMLERYPRQWFHFYEFWK